MFTLLLHRSAWPCELHQERAAGFSPPRSAEGTLNGLVDQADCGTRNVDGDVTAAYYDHSFAQFNLEIPGLR